MSSSSHFTAPRAPSPEEEVEKLWGGNLLRVMQEVEEVARGMRMAP